MWQANSPWISLTSHTHTHTHTHRQTHTHTVAHTTIQKNDWTYLPWVLCGSGDAWSDMDKQSEEVTEKDRHSVNRQMRGWELLDVWELPHVHRSHRVRLGGSYLWCERRVRAGWEGCSARGYTPLSRIQISARTGPVRRKRKDKVICNPSFIFTHQSCLPVFLYLAVSGSDHVDVVANQLEREASVHESKATLHRDSETDHLTQTKKESIGNNCKWKQFWVADCLYSLYRSLPRTIHSQLHSAACSPSNVL